MINMFMKPAASLVTYLSSYYLGIGLKPPVPSAISVELSAVCNLSCPECVTGTGSLLRGSEFMEFSLAEKIARAFSGKLVSVYLYYQGEPMMHPRFFDIIELFRGRRTVVSTNGHFLDRENCYRLASGSLKKIIISYDGLSQDTYGIYRRKGDHQRVKEGIYSLTEIIRQMRSSLTVELQFLAGKHNEHEISGAADFAREVRAGFRVKSMQVLDIGRAALWVPEDMRLSRYVSSGESYRPVRTASRGCFRMWTSAVITTDGDVVPCCYDKNAVFAMGNLLNSSFHEIWNGEKYRSFRASVLKDRSSFDICTGCQEGAKLFFRK